MKEINVCFSSTPYTILEGNIEQTVKSIVNQTIPPKNIYLIHIVPVI
jgi:hypothetical protein